MARRKKDDPNWGGAREGSGRPPAGDEKRKQFQVRLSDEEHDLVQRAAKKDGKKVTAWVRDVAIWAAKILGE